MYIKDVKEVRPESEWFLYLYDKVFWDEEKSSFVWRIHPQENMCILAAHEMILVADVKDKEKNRKMCGFWTLNRETYVYERQFIGQSMENIIFTTDGDGYELFMCDRPTIVGQDVLSFFKVTISYSRDTTFSSLEKWVLHMLKRLENSEKKVHELEANMSVIHEAISNIQDACENLTYLPGMPEYEKARKDFETKSLAFS
jgi:hypothetical protein